jgi:hypothetical protein
MLTNLILVFLPGQNSEAIKTIDAKPLQKNSNNTKTTNWMLRTPENSLLTILKMPKYKLAWYFYFRCRKMDKSVPVLYIAKVEEKPSS